MDSCILPCKGRVLEDMDGHGSSETVSWACGICISPCTCMGGDVEEFYEGTYSNHVINVSIVIELIIMDHG